MAYRSPDPKLEQVKLTVDLPTPANLGHWRLEMQGWSRTKRGSLWHREVDWASHEVDHGLQVADEVNFRLLAILQDRPSSPFWLDRAERGLPGGVQLSLDL